MQDFLLNDDNKRPMRARPTNTAPVPNKDDPRARAAALAAAIREQRSEREYDGVDDFRAPPAPDGWVYQWKRKSVFNKEDFSHQNELKSNGWSEVPRTRHPEFMPIGLASANIEHKEMVLMECPQELVNDAYDRQRQAYSAQKTNDAGRLNAKEGTMLGNQTQETTRKLSGSYSPISIPN